MNISMLVLKTADSMAEKKCQRKNLPLTAKSAQTDSGMLSAFVLLQDLWMTFTKLLTLSVQMPGIHIFKEKDYINQVDLMATAPTTSF